jgi:putative tricarboxylic transport membrane protein
MLAKVSLSFQSADYFALMVLGLSAVAAFSGKGQILKALIMTVFGLMLSTVGTDRATGVERFTFGSIDLLDGISFLLLAMATFALAEAMMSVLERTDEDAEPQDMSKLGSMKLSAEEVKEVAPTVARSSVLGFLVGVLPGAGATIAAFLAYGVDRNLARGDSKNEFGNGSLRGLAAPEAANNAASSGSFVPLLTLGIPGSGTTAIMLGALISYGIQPGPRLFVDNPEVFWSVIISMYFGNVVPADHTETDPGADDPAVFDHRRLPGVVQLDGYPDHGRHLRAGDIPAPADFPDGAAAARLHPRRHDGRQPAARAVD